MTFTSVKPEKMPKFCVYGITDKDGNVVYVGSSRHPVQRFRQHLNPKTSGPKYIYEWSKTIDYTPTLKVLEACANDSEMCESELRLIVLLRPKLNKRIVIRPKRKEYYF